MERKGYYTAIQVAVMLGISEATLNHWYRFKKENPRSKYAKMIPKFKQFKNHQQRYWTHEDIWKLAEFQSKMPKGRGGIMGSVTQRYCKKEEK